MANLIQMQLVVGNDGIIKLLDELFLLNWEEWYRWQLLFAAGVPERDSLITVSPSEVDSGQSRDTATQVHSSVDLLSDPYDDMEIDEDLLDDDGMEDMFHLDLGLSMLSSSAVTRMPTLPLLPPNAGMVSPCFPSYVFKICFWALLLMLLMSYVFLNGQSTKLFLFRMVAYFLIIACLSVVIYSIKYSACTLKIICCIWVHCSNHINLRIILISDGPGGLDSLFKQQWDWQIKDFHGEKWFTVQPNFEKKSYVKTFTKLSMHSPIKFSIGHCTENGECTSTPLRPSTRILSKCCTQITRIPVLTF